MIEFLEVMLATSIGTAVGAAFVSIVLDDALQNPSSESKEGDGRLNEERAALWREMYMRQCIKAGRSLDKVRLIKFDALVVSYSRNEMTYQNFRDELDRLENPELPSGCQRQSMTPRRSSGESRPP